MINGIKSFVILFILGFSVLPCSIFATQSSLTFERGVISHPDQPELSIEFFYLLPQGKGPFPTLFLVPGWQPEKESQGGKQLAEYGYLHRLVEEGIAAVSISVPGYGQSGGKRDFGGPFSQRAIEACIDHFKEDLRFDAEKMGLYGISRGAPLCAMVAAQYPGLTLQILESGLYDLFSLSWVMPDYLKGIQANCECETDGTSQALSIRSPLYHAEKMDAATLILHGEYDDRRGLTSAELLNKQLQTYGVNSRLKVYPNVGHCLTADKWDEIMPFLKSRFFNLSGIGIHIADATPAFQITKIHSDSPAALTGRLRIGDVILSISPNNDSKEMNTLTMPTKQFTSLALGKRGTYLRLHVQHFDLTNEDIVIERDFP